LLDAAIGADDEVLPVAAFAVVAGLSFHHGEGDGGGRMALERRRPRGELRPCCARGRQPSPRARAGLRAPRSWRALAPCSGPATAPARGPGCRHSR
jgi:hypothetical protein